MTLLHRLLIFFFLSLVALAPFPPVENHAFAKEDPFPLLPGLEASVEFWKQVFTKYKTTELVFYDATNPTKIYKVVEAKRGRGVRRLIRAERRKIKLKYGLKSTSGVHVQRGAKERFVMGLEQSRRYLEQMQRIFEERGLPNELVYLPLIESSFQIKARSRAGAVGIWQFMPRTGRRFLRVTSRVDERKDPLESTRAAASLLEENYELFGNWPLAITAYNYGERGLLRAVKKVGSSNLVDIIRQYRSHTFGISSKNFYAEFMAALEVVSKVEDYFPDIEYDSPILMEEIKLEQPISVTSLIKSTGISRQEFLSWNPALSTKVVFLPKWYRVKIPAKNEETFVAAYQKIVNRPWIRHLVEKGETLSQIARSYRISVFEIQNVNGISNIHLITVGQQLKIPTP